MQLFYQRLTVPLGWAVVSTSRQSSATAESTEWP